MDRIRLDSIDRVSIGLDWIERVKIGLDCLGLVLDWD